MLPPCPPPIILSLVLLGMVGLATAASSSPESSLSVLHPPSQSLSAPAKLSLLVVRDPGPDHDHDHDHDHNHDHDHDHAGHNHQNHDHDRHRDHHDPGHDPNHGNSTARKQCHFHAGVEHCTLTDEIPDRAQCQLVKRDYDIGLRVGLLFVILVTSAIAVFGPILLQKVLPRKLALVFTFLKQLGTGIIISTAFVHLYTHASLMFSNECMGKIDFEGVTSAIVIAGLFLSFIVEFAGQRLITARAQKELEAPSPANKLLSTEMVAVLIMEAGILFHSLLIGLTLVVAGDSAFLTLFIVILFHQMFEGLAIGTRIASIGTTCPAPATGKSDAAPLDDAPDHLSPAASQTSPGISTRRKFFLASLFAFVTPIGMAIGIAVLHKFNGNDRSTLIAIGTLNALSAGILIWVGVVEMWAADWITGSHGRQAELVDADLFTVTLAAFGLILGLVLMSLLGKWV